MIILLIVGLFVAFYIIGGQTKGRLRDIPCPLLLGVAVGLKLGVIAGILTWIGANAMRLGYGNYSPEDDPKPSWLASLTHDRGGWWIRLIWGGLVSAGAGAAYAYFTGHYAFYFLYVIGNCAIGFTVSKARLNWFWTDLLVSLGLCSIVAWIKLAGG